MILHRPKHLLACCIFVFGCEPSSMVSPQQDAGLEDAPTGTDPLGTSYEARVVPDGQMAIAGTFEGKTAWLALDTGASPTIIGKTLETAAGTKTGTMSLGPLNAKRTFYSIDLAEADAFVGVTLGALVGPDILGLTHEVVFDYARSRLYFLDAAPTASPWGTVDPPIHIPFVLTQGIPVVEATLGKAGPVKIIADTGSGVTILLQSMWDKIQDGTLPELGGYVWKTLSGDIPGIVVRLPSVTFGEPLGTALGTWAIVVPDNNIVSNYLVSNGLPGAFLGYPIYRRFVLGFSVPDARFSYWPLEKLAEPANEWTRVGFEVSARVDGFRVEWIYVGSDAEMAGVQKGDVVTSIDGATPSDLGDCRARLGGTPGQTRKLSMTRAGAPLEMTVKIEDLLPALP